MVFQHLRAFVGLVAKFHGFGPDEACNAAQHSVFGIDAIREKEREIRCEFVDVHSPGNIIFHVSEAVGQRKGQLCDRIGAGFGNVVA